MALRFDSGFGVRLRSKEPECASSGPQKLWGENDPGVGVDSEVLLLALRDHDWGLEARDPGETGSTSS